MPTRNKARKTLTPALALGAALVTGAAPALAATDQAESYQALTGQAQKGQVRSAIFDQSRDQVRVRLSDGRHFAVTYSPSNQAQLTSALQSHGATVHVKRATHHKAKASSHIRYRYIALAILVLAALAALGYYLLRGRPSAAGPAAGAGGVPPAGSGAAGEAPPAGTNAPAGAARETGGPAAAGGAAPREAPPGGGSDVG